MNELRHLSDTQRPEVTKALAEAAAEGDRSENAEYIYRKKQLREIDRRIRYLVKRLEVVKASGRHLSCSLWGNGPELQRYALSASLRH